MADAEGEAIRRALTATVGNKSQAARLLRTNYTTLHAKMKRYGISAAEFQGSNRATMPSLSSGATVPLLLLMGVVMSVGVHQVFLWLGRGREALHPWVVAWCANSL